MPDKPEIYIYQHTFKSILHNVNQTKDKSISLSTYKHYAVNPVKQ